MAAAACAASSCANRLRQGRSLRRGRRVEARGPRAQLSAASAPDFKACPNTVTLRKGLLLLATACAASDGATRLKGGHSLR